MHRIARLLLPLTTMAALAVIATLVLPIGAQGAAKGGRSMSGNDTYLFGEDGTISGPVNGNVTVLDGSLTVADVIAGDLLIIGGSVTFTGNGRIRGNLIHGGTALGNAEGRVDGRIYSFATPQGALATVSKMAFHVSLLFVWTIAAIILTLASGREVRASSIEVRASGLHCFVLGLVAFTSFLISAIAFSYLIPYLIGIPLLAALLVFAKLTKIYGMIAVFHAVGTLVAGARRRDQLASRKWLRGDLAMVMVGILILGAIRLIPVIGTIVWSLASVVGLGVALATKFGRREPWFLEWKPTASLSS